MPELDPKRLDWKGVRFLDPTGRVFEHEGEIYRAIYPHAGDHVRSLFARGVIDRLVDRKLLVETTVSTLRVTGYGMVLQHGRIPYLSRPGHWPRSLLRDAARLVVDLNLELTEFGLGTIDFHPENIHQIDACRPIWIDLGSIQPLSRASATGGARAQPRRSRKALWRAVRERAAQRRLKKDVARMMFVRRAGIANVPEEFRWNYLYPLALLAKNVEWGRPVRLFLDPGGIGDTEYRLLGGGAAFPRFGRERRDWLEGMRGWLDDLAFPALRTHRGADYARDPFAAGNIATLDPRSAVVDRLVRRQRPRRVIDLGCSAGFFSALASRAAPGCDVYAVDSDEEAVECLYRGARGWTEQASITAALDNVLTLPGPGGLGVERQRSEDPFRTHADLALALSLSHHLFFRQSCRFPVIAKLLASFTTDSLLTEFMPNGLGRTVPKPDPLPADYTLETFVGSFEPHFRDVEVIRWPIPAGHAPRIFVHARGKL